MEAGAKGKTYKIGQAAKLLDVKPFVLRFWESEFGHVLVPVRTPAGQRAYTEANLALVRAIKSLLYDEGLTIEGAKKRLGQPQGPAREPARPAPAASPAPDGKPGSTGPCGPDLRAVVRDIEHELKAIRDLLSG